MHISPIKSTDNNPKNFGKLKSIRYVQSDRLFREVNSAFFEKILIGKELRKLAEKNKFFQDFDVKARINVIRGKGSFLTLNCKPAAKSFKEEVSNFFSIGKKIKIKSNARCPEDSAYIVANEVRSIGKKDNLYKKLEKKTRLKPSSFFKF